MSWKKVPIPEKIGPEKKYRSRYRKNLVPEKSTGPGTGKNWSRKKVPVPVPEKILGTVTLCRGLVSPMLLIFDDINIPLRETPNKKTANLAQTVKIHQPTP